MLITHTHKFKRQREIEILINFKRLSHGLNDTRLQVTITVTVLVTLAEY